MVLGPRGGKQLKTYGTLGAVGIELGLSTVLGLFAGRWADERFGTQPWLLIVGLLVGVTSGFRSLIREARKASRQSDSEAKDSDSDAP